MSVDEMHVDEMYVDEMFVDRTSVYAMTFDEMPVNKMTCCLILTVQV
jgi:hypothetical protein